MTEFVWEIGLKYTRKKDRKKQIEKGSSRKGELREGEDRKSEKVYKSKTILVDSDNV